MWFERIVGVGALIAAGLWIVSFAALPPPPAVDATTDEIIAFAGERAGLITSLYTVDVLPAVAFAALGAALWTRLRPDPAAMLGLLGMTGLAIAMFGWGVVDALLAAQGERGADAATLQATFELYNIGHIPAHASISLAVAGFAIAGHHAHLFPRWATPLAVFIAASGLVVLPAGFVANDALETLHVLSVLGFVGWIIMAATSLLRAPAPAPNPVLVSAGVTTSGEVA